MEENRPTEHPLKGSPGASRAEGSTWETYKCSRCGAMFEMTSQSGQDCPVCGYQCSSSSCQVIASSREEY